jgi:hypothetical protein
VKSELEKKRQRETVEFVVGPEEYVRFEKYAKEQGLTQDGALRVALLKGMHEFWSQHLVEMAESCSRLEERIEGYQKDNAVLNALYDQNLELKKLLGPTGAKAERD